MELMLCAGANILYLAATGDLNSQVVERSTRDGEVAGSSLTHCAVEYGPQQAAHTPASVTKQNNLVLVESGDTPKLGR